MPSSGIETTSPSGRLAIASLTIRRICAVS